MSSPDTKPRASFLAAESKARATAAVRVFEEKTSAELVVTVRRAARGYPEADLGLGALFAFVTLLFLLFHPAEFATALMPVDVLCGFGAGFGVSRLFPRVRKLAVSSAKRRSAVDQAAKASFVDLGVSRTKGRTGVLVYVALFELHAKLVCDIGVTDEAKKAALAAVPALEAALARSDVNAFAAALESLGPEFGKTMPRAVDDENELPDDVA